MEFKGRVIALQTYKAFAKKYGIPVRGNDIPQLQKEIHEYERNHQKSIKKGLYIMPKNPTKAELRQYGYY